MTTPRMQFSFPVVATIRKGTPKKPSNGKMIQGDDLKDRFRVVFFPGADEYKELFLQAHPECKGQQHILVSRLHAMMPFGKAFDCLEIWNEAYQAGRMVVRATDTQVITRRDPLTGEYLVRDGQPYEAFDPAVQKAITYERGGKTFTLPMRTAIRLKLFLPGLARMVAFELKSTSYYDSLNLRQQLAAIQMMADMLNNGIAGGIPFFVFRREQEVCWNKKDGSAARIGKWLINIEIDPEWVKAATVRMANFALTGQQIAGLLTPTVPLAGEEDPSLDSDDPEEDALEESALEASEDIIDVEPEFEPDPQPEPAPEIPVIDRTEPAPQESAAPSTPKEIIAAAPHDAEGSLARPMGPEVLRAALAVKIEALAGRKEPSDKQINLLRMLIEQCFAGEESVIKIRRSVTSYLIGVESLNDATGAQVQALLDWLKPVVKGDSGEYLVDKLSAKEITTVWTAALKEAGQMSLFEA